MNRYVIRSILLLIAMGALALIIIMFRFKEIEKWGVIIACLAVITAIISAWNTQRIVEVEEDKKKPYIEIFFDLYSRYLMLQLVIKNTGGSPAYDVKVIWDKSIISTFGKIVTFDNMQILRAGETISIFVDTTTKMIVNTDLNYSGTIIYKDSFKKKRKQNFCISLEQYRKAVTFSEESLKTHHELQKLPKALKKIEEELKKLSQS